MRLSTSQFYQNNLNHITNKSGQANKQLDKLSSWLRVQTAADDPVAANGILNYKQELNNIARYQNNIKLGENRLQREESILTTAENLSQQAKELMLKANNGTYTAQEKAALGSELSSRIDELLDLANSRDEFGDYIFAGFQTDAEPFLRQADGSVSYQGDSGQRELAISDNVKVALNHDGNLVFGQVPNSKGDLTASYNLQGGVREQGLMVEQAEINDATNVAAAQPYTLTFSDNAGVVEVLVSDRDGNALLDSNGDPMAAQPYQPGQAINAGGISITLTGEAKAGDDITLQADAANAGEAKSTVSVFDALSRAQSWLEGDGDTASEQSEFADILGELDAVGGHFTRIRADTGIRLQRLDNQKETHADMALTVDKVRSGMEDLDYAQAIGELNQTMVALQASQSVFGKLQGMSLFNYI